MVERSGSARGAESDNPYQPPVSQGDATPAAERTRRRAIAAVVVNSIWPGGGTLVLRRYLEGAVQVGLWLAGAWLLKDDKGGFDLGLLGFLLVTAAWIWGLAVGAIAVGRAYEAVSRSTAEEGMNAPRRRSPRVSRARTVVGLLINVGLFPGVGSLMIKRYLAGAIQLVLFTVGAILSLSPLGAAIGGVAMIIAWVWGLVVGLVGIGRAYQRGGTAGQPTPAP